MSFLKTTISFWIGCTLLISSLQAQNYSTHQLPLPQAVPAQFAQSITSNSIYYGARPTNLDPSKPVIVYVHGFSDLAGVWFNHNNAVYQNTYNANQNCAFVAMTKGQGMWKNGELLAHMLDGITAHFGVSKVVIVAHSNGGKATEVAMITHNRRNKVDRVITLGTPFSGTPLANVAQIPGFNFVVALVGLGGGMRTSTTYYMGGYARPRLDWSFRNQPGKFINFGAWGYNNGTTNQRVLLTAGGLLLNTLGAGAFWGGNDGVTPYWSSDRPSGKPQWTTGYGNPVSRFDHIDIALSRNVWSHIQPLFTAPLSSIRSSARNEGSAIAANETISSSLQFISSEDANMSFVVENDVRALTMTVLHESDQDLFELKKVSPSGQLLDVALDINALRQTSALVKGKSSLIPLHQLEAGTYKIVSSSTFAAIVNNENGVELEYNNQHQFALDEKTSFQVNLNRAEQYDLSKLSLKAIITHKSTLEGTAVEATSFIETFELDADGNYTLRPNQSLANGVYNMIIKAQHPAFQKDLVTGFVVNNNQVTTTQQVQNQTAQNLSVYPNPATDFIDVRFNNQQTAQLNLYDINGRILHQQTVKTLGEQQLKLDLNALKLVQGTYFLEIQEGAKKATQIFVKLP